MYIIRYRNFYVATSNECSSFCAAFAQPPKNKIDGATPDSELHSMPHGLTPAAWVLFRKAFVHLEREYENQTDNVSVPPSDQAPRLRLPHPKSELEFEFSQIHVYRERLEEREKPNILCSDPELVRPL